MTRDIERRLTGTLTALASQITEHTLSQQPPLPSVPTHVVELSEHQTPQRMRMRWLAPLIAAASVAAVVVATVALVKERDRSEAPMSPDSSVTQQPSPPSTTVPATPMLPLGKEAGADEVPWNQLGQGWLLAYVMSNTPGTDGRLYLLNPVGGRYALAMSPSAPVAWSPDGQRALFETAKTGTDEMVVTERELRTDKVLHRFTYTVKNSGALTYTRPVGRAVVIGSDYVSGYVKYGLDGSVQAHYPNSTPALGRFNSGPIYTPDGLHLFIGAQKGIAYLGNGGEVAREIAAPSGYQDCAPHHMIDASSVTLSCFRTANGSISDVFEYSVATGSMKQITTTRVDGQHGLGFIDEFGSAHGTLLATAQGCGGETVSTLNADGTGTPLDIPRPAGITSRLALVAIDQNAVLMLAQGCSGTEAVLVRYDLATHTSAVVLGGTVTGGSAQFAWTFEPQR